MGKRKSEVAKLMMSLDRDIKATKLKKKETRFEHWHKVDKSKLRLRPYEKLGPLWFRCLDCKMKVNMKLATKEPEEIEKEINKAADTLINSIEIAKLTLNPKTDQKEFNNLVKAEKRIYRVAKYLIISVARKYKNGKKKNRDGGQKRHYNFSLGGGGMRRR